MTHDKCPHCGAAEYQAVPGEFRCGGGFPPIAPFVCQQSEVCKELCALRQRVTELEKRNAWLERWREVVLSILCKSGILRAFWGLSGSSADYVNIWVNAEAFDNAVQEEM